MGRSKTAPVPRDFKSVLEDCLVVQADSAEELAANLQIDASTLASYNRYADKGCHPDFGRSLRRLSGARTTRIDATPYYGFVSGNALTTTYCGLKIDERLRVLDLFDDPIEGLWATDEVVGGFHGAGYMSGIRLA
jgi:fumarate reductase flavoprotein subunit